MQYLLSITYHAQWRSVFFFNSRRCSRSESRTFRRDPDSLSPLKDNRFPRSTSFEGVRGFLLPMLLPSPRPLLPCRPRTCVVWRPDKAPPPADDLAALLWEKAGVGEGGSPLKGSGTVGPKVDVVLRGELVLLQTSYLVRHKQVLPLYRLVGQRGLELVLRREVAPTNTTNNPAVPSYNILFPHNVCSTIQRRWSGHPLPWTS